MRDGGQEVFCRDAYPRLVRALDLYCGDRHLAEELAQEALLRACRRWGHVSGLESPARLDVAGQQPGSNANVLSSEHDIDPVSGTAVLNGIPVDVQHAP